MIMPTPVVEIKNVSKKFCSDLKLNLFYGLQDIFKMSRVKELPKLRRHEFWALRDINLSISRGEIVGILGMNGAGKTTLIRTIIGAYPVSFGEIFVRGRITTVFERTRAFQRYYSGEENIRVKCALFGMSKEEVDEKLPHILEFAEVADFAEAPFGTYSAGMRARINFAISMMANPDLLIIDEGLAVSDVRFRKKCMEALKEVKKDTAVLLVSHNLEQFTELADRLIVMEKGRVVHESTDIQEGIDFALSNKPRT